ncbi:hypothetical protein PABG_12354 [Paracoccidioides brasiliensis Pb03]|nr:hypothetical protein PABG_12354 [Paracoccidioides brasiliensis Pb03]
MDAKVNAWQRASAIRFATMESVGKTLAISDAAFPSSVKLAEIGTVQNHQKIGMQLWEISEEQWHAYIVTTFLQFFPKGSCICPPCATTESWPSGLLDGTGLPCWRRRSMLHQQERPPNHPRMMLPSLNFPRLRLQERKPLANRSLQSLRKTKGQSTFGAEAHAMVLPVEVMIALPEPTRYAVCKVTKRNLF